MSGTQPVAVYAMKVPPGDILVPACPEFAAMFRVSMAAIDPTAEPELEDVDDKKPPRATLKIVRVPSDMFGDDDEDESDDEDYLDGSNSDESGFSDDDEVNGGPSDPKKLKKNKLLEMIQMVEAEDDDDEMGEDGDSSEEEAEAKALLKKLMKGKDKAVDGEESDSELDDDEEGLELDEVVVCTLDPQSHYQQTLDFVVGEDEKVFFKVSGNLTVHLTGNYVIPIDDGQTSLYDEEDEDDYDLEPDEDELDELDELDALEDEESDELDDLEDPRVIEVDSEEEVAKTAQKPKKGKNKRPAEDSDVGEDEPTTLDDLIAKAKTEDAAAPVTNGDDKKLTKAEKKKLKKLKKNDGEAVPVSSSVIAPASSEPKQKTPEAKKEPGLTNGSGSEKKVQFAKNLEQGPTPSATPPAKVASDKKSTSGGLGIRNVDGVTVDDRKLGSGAQAKKGSRVEMRYIGKLDNGKVFDSNKSGKPFAFKLGKGEVIKGWDVGLAGIMAGGERRLIIPADLAYGKKGAPPDIPPNAKLTFDCKCLSIK